MKILPATISLFNDLYFWSGAETLRTLHREGIKTRHGKPTEYGNTFRGAYYFFIDPAVRTEVINSVRNGLRYRERDHDHFFSKGVIPGYNPSPQRIGKIILTTDLSTKRLRIFDAGCNHGQLVDYIKQPIESYLGMDLFEETISTAKKDAKERFKKINCSNYKFIQGDIVVQGSYKGLPRNHNLVVCTGVLGHFRPKHIALILDNLNEMLSCEESSRIFIQCPVINSYGSKNLEKIRIEENMKFIEKGTRGNRLYFRCYDMKDLIRFIEEQCKFNIDWASSDTSIPDTPLGFKSIILSLKKRY